MKNTKMKKFLAVVLSAALVAGLAEYAFGIDKDQPELVEQVNAFIK